MRKQLLVWIVALVSLRSGASAILLHMQDDEIKLLGAAIFEGKRQTVIIARNESRPFRIDQNPRRTPECFSRRVVIFDSRDQFTKGRCAGRDVLNLSMSPAMFAKPIESHAGQTTTPAGLTGFPARSRTADRGLPLKEALTHA